ncbi:MAG: hypothetical protein QQN55_07380 [Nitrosopumilus sp.]|nr:hypothetical protein [Candidatus Neomarinimicrobiota bacterium]
MSDETLINKILRLSIEEYSEKRPEEKKVIKELNNGIANLSFQDSQWLSTVLNCTESPDLDDGEQDENKVD